MDKKYKVRIAIIFSVVLIGIASYVSAAGLLNPSKPSGLLSPINISNTIQDRLIASNNIVVNMPAPTSATSSVSAGGSLVATTTYYYVVTASDGVGETIASNETSALTTSANKTITVSWSAVTGATAYKIYRATSTQGYSSSSLATSTVSTSLTDNGLTLLSGSVSSETTAYYSKISSSSQSWFIGGNVGIGTATPGYKLDVLGDNSSTTIKIGSATNAGCIIIGDNDLGGVTYVTALNGVLSATTTKPSVCK